MTKILLVEDDKSLREIYGVRLLAEGYDIISAGDGEEALAMAIKDRPALIISDVMMPKISGFDMLDILRSTTETKTIKVIMMTALSSEDQRSRGEQLGADRYLVKSQVGIEDVVRTVHEVLADAPTTSNSTSSSAPTATAPSNVASSQPRPAAPMPPRAPEPQAPRPAPNPIAPQQPSAQEASATSQSSQPNDSGFSLPRPTAPFSTQRPAGLGLSDRVINPLPKPAETGPNVSERMEEELSDEPHLPELGSITSLPAADNPSATASQETPPVTAQTANRTDGQAPAQLQSSVTPGPNPFATNLPTPPTPPSPFSTQPPAATQSAQPNASDISFEETPRPPANPFSTDNRPT